MQVTCPQCRALADGTYERPLFRRAKCRHCGYELEEISNGGVTS
jgi:ribosomal protein S27E